MKIGFWLEFGNKGEDRARVAVLSAVTSSIIGSGELGGEQLGPALPEPVTFVLPVAICLLFLSLFSSSLRFFAISSGLTWLSLNGLDEDEGEGEDSCRRRRREAS